MKRIFAEKMFQRVDCQFVPEVVFLYLIPHLPKNPYTNLTSIPPRRARFTEDTLLKKNRKKCQKSYFSRRLEDQRRNLHKNP